MKNGQSLANLPRPSLRPEPPDLIRWPLVDAAERVPTRGSSHIHWTITAFMRLTDQGDMQDSVQVVVEAGNEREAICRAQDLIERAHYRVTAVNEVCSLDEALKHG